MTLSDYLSSPKLQDLHLHSCRGSLPFEDPNPNPTAHSFPAAPGRLEKGGPQGTVSFLARAWVVWAAAPLPQLRLESVPRQLSFASAATLTWARSLGGRRLHATGCEGTPRWQTRASAPELCLQPGRTAPTLPPRRPPRDCSATHSRAPRPLPTPFLGAGLLPARSPLSECERNLKKMPPLSAKAGYPQRVFPLQQAAQTPLSRLDPGDPSPASAPSLGPSLSIKPGAKHCHRSFQEFICPLPLGNQLQSLISSLVSHQNKASLEVVLQYC
ncbi:uncharacterized protein LOC124100689 [Marmota monax]|uniref:uncharacterized protein LOC124100689 n=1 Tax=Marmota monax TaxID=9995 RepID=UPI001EB07915|nr:uncharacterized protein LOC124100689 [Marmota monax]